MSGGSVIKLFYVLVFPFSEAQLSRPGVSLVFVFFFLRKRSFASSAVWILTSKVAADFPPPLRSQMYLTVFVLVSVCQNLTGARTPPHGL